jgi:hypothetical protein
MLAHHTLKLVWLRVLLLALRRSFRAGLSQSQLPSALSPPSPMVKPIYHPLHFLTKHRTSSRINFG